MSANLLVDLGGTCQLGASLPGGITLSPSGFVAGLSGRLVGDIVDLVNADTYCNVLVQGRSVTSGPLVIMIQDSPTTNSGDFTDPTSGLQQMPTWVSSGGQLLIGQSGTNPGTVNAGNGVSGQFLLSGFAVAAAFQRKNRYARLLLGSGFYDGEVQGTIISQQRTTGSGGGYSTSPSSGIVSV